MTALISVSPAQSLNLWPFKKQRGSFQWVLWDPHCGAFLSQGSESELSVPLKKGGCSPSRDNKPGAEQLNGKASINTDNPGERQN